MVTGPVNALEIYVSHTTYDLVVAEGNQGLFLCKIGLGSAEFPTPVGEYFITYVYDQDPWWIPPKNRPWAYGMKPSKAVYGGTMSPLLKKKCRGTSLDGEDYVALECNYIDNDYRLHGTNQIWAVGRNQSHGCIRMLPQDAKRVADLIKQHVGISGKGETENGTFITLNSPVRLTILR